jgi:hypothetical protein
MIYGSVCSGIEAATKHCAACGELKPIDAFHKQGARRHSYCADCYNARYRGKARKPIAPETKRAHNLKSRYGLTGEDVAALIERQSFVCAICNGPLKRAVVDHDHATGAVRGVLCHPCNIKLPAVEDEVYRSAALRYLKGR